MTLDALERPAPAARGGLSHVALLVVRGPDARAFLDGQLTRDVPDDVATAAPAGYCSPKGRLLATFVVWCDRDDVFLLVAADIAPAIAKRLRMYVLRAKAVVEDVGAAHAIDGFADTAAKAAEALAPWGVARDGDTTWIRWPDADARPRWLRVAPAGAGRDGSVDSATWRWLDIRAGLATVTAATQERFVPQMLNLEAVGGVDFRKGCYPGQEVVARSQYLGKLKRRMARAWLAPDAPVPAAGRDVVAGAEPVGVVVDAERGADRRVALLVELPVAQFASDALAIDDAALLVEPPPYALPDQEIFVRPKL